MKTNMPEMGNGIGIGGSVAWVFGYFKHIDWLTTTGVLVAVGGFLINWHYSRQRDKRDAAAEKRERERHEIEMRWLRGEVQDGNEQ